MRCSLICYQRVGNGCVIGVVLVMGSPSFYSPGKTYIIAQRERAPQIEHMLCIQSPEFDPWHYIWFPDFYSGTILNTEPGVSSGYH